MINERWRKRKKVERRRRRRRGDVPRTRERENKCARQERWGRAESDADNHRRGNGCNHQEEEDDYRPAVQLRRRIRIGWLTSGPTRPGFISPAEDRWGDSGPKGGSNEFGRGRVGLRLVAGVSFCVLRAPGLESHDRRSSSALVGGGLRASSSLLV